MPPGVMLLKAESLPVACRIQSESIPVPPPPSSMAYLPLISEAPSSALCHLYSEILQRHTPHCPPNTTHSFMPQCLCTQCTFCQPCLSLILSLGQASPPHVSFPQGIFLSTSSQTGLDTPKHPGWGGKKPKATPFNITKLEFLSWLSG